MTRQEYDEELTRVRDAVKLFVEGGPAEYYIPSTKVLYSFVKDKREEKVRVYRIVDAASVYHIDELREKHEWFSLFSNCPYGALSLSNQIKEALYGK